jgi:hypothetical protein
LRFLRPIPIKVMKVDIDKKIATSPINCRFPETLKDR